MRLMSTILMLSVVALACGRPAPRAVSHVTTPIIGGSPDPEHPSVVAILIEGPYGSGLCSGTLISPRVVLTAAHCVVDEEGSGSPAYVVFGADVDSGVVVPVKDSVAHPDYNAYGGGGYGVHDIGVVVLSTPGPAVPSPYRTENVDGLLGASIAFVGFGTTDPDSSQSVGVKYVVEATIGAIEPQGIWNYTTPAAPKNTCNGDSGGPAFLLGSRNPEVISVTSSGDWYCAEDGWNTRVDANADWVAEMVAQFDPNAAGPQCGDGACETGETCALCAADCGECPEVGVEDAPAPDVQEAGSEQAEEAIERIDGENDPSGDGLSAVDQASAADTAVDTEDQRSAESDDVGGTEAALDVDREADEPGEDVASEQDTTTSGCAVCPTSQGPAPLAAFLVLVGLLTALRRRGSARTRSAELLGEGGVA